MIENGGGVIVNTVFSNSYKPTAYNGIYAMSKHALNALTKSVAQDYQEQKVFAVGVAPYTMQTNISQSAMTTMDEQIGMAIGVSTPPNIPATAEEVAEAMLFAMKNGKLLNGSTVNCAGGQIYS